MRKVFERGWLWGCGRGRWNGPRGVSELGNVSRGDRKASQPRAKRGRWRLRGEGKARTTGERVGSLFRREVWLGSEGSWRGAFRWVRDGVTGVPEGDPLHRAVTTGTGGAVGKLGVGFVGGLEVGFQWCGRLPGLAFGVGQQGSLVEEGSDAVEIVAAGGV